MAKTTNPASLPLAQAKPPLEIEAGAIPPIEVPFAGIPPGEYERAFIGHTQWRTLDPVELNSLTALLRGLVAKRARLKDGTVVYLKHHAIQWLLQNMTFAGKA